jgi:histone H2B
MEVALLHHEDFSKELRLIASKVHPDMTWNDDVISQINFFINIIATKFRDTILHLLDNLTGKQTISSREIQTAVRIILPGELSKHAISEATKAVTIYFSKDKGVKIPKGNPGAVNMTKRKIRDVLTCGNRLRIFRISAGTPYYFSAVLEYLAAEIFELSGNQARDMQANVGTARHLFLAMNGDEEFTKLFRDLHLQIVGGGVLPNISAKILPRVQVEVEENEGGEEGEEGEERGPRTPRDRLEEAVLNHPPIRGSPTAEEEFSLEEL